MRGVACSRGRTARCVLVRGARGQIWVETVIYTLIGLAIIGMVLAGALPKINAKKDEMTIDRSIEAIGNIDDKIYEVQRAAGNRRVINLDVKKGSFIVNPAEDSISWILDSSFAYSEVGTTIPFGNMNVTTTGNGDYKIELKIGYKMNLTYDGDGIKEKQFNVAPIPYKIIIENKGKDDDGNILIDLSEI